MRMAIKICVLASGGDAPGMNACVKAIYEYGKTRGVETYVGLNGLDGLIDEQFARCTDENTANIANRAGCVFFCGRCKRFNDSKGVMDAVASFKKNKFDALVIIGGNGSQIATGRLKQAGIPTVFIPGTIDNDVPNTKNSLGFSSALESAIRNIDDLTATMTTIKRDHIVELMGRGSNELATVLGLASFADVVDMEGQRHTPEQIADVFVKNRKAGKTSNFAIMQENKSPSAVTMAVESAKFLEGVQIACKDDTVRTTTLGFLQRGATPSCRDRWLAVLYGHTAIDLILKKQFGKGITYNNDKIELYEIAKKPI